MLVGCDKPEEVKPESTEPAVAKPIVSKTEKIKIDLTAPTPQRWGAEVTGFDIPALKGRVLVPQKEADPQMAAFTGNAGMMRIDLGTPFKAGTFDPANFMVTNAVNKAQCAYSSLSKDREFKIVIEESGEKLKATFEGEVNCRLPDDEKPTKALIKGHFDL